MLAVTAAPELRDWLMSLVDFARRAADRHVGVVFCYFLNDVAPYLGGITLQLDELNNRRVVILWLVDAR